MDVDYNALDSANTTINIIAFTITLPLSLLLFWRHGFLRMDKSATFILLTYIVAFFSRMFSSKANYSVIDMIVPISSTLVWGALLYFVLEMNHIHTLLISQSHLEFRQKVRTINFTRGFLLGNLAVVYFPINLVIFVYRDEFKNYFYETLTVVVIIRAISLAIFCLYLFPAFFYHFYFFVTEKAKRNLENSNYHQSLTAQNIFMIIWVFLLWLMKLLYALASIFLVTIERLGDNVQQKQPRLFFLYYFAMRMFALIVDFLFVITLIYLFDFQAKISRDQKETSQEQNMADAVLEIDEQDIEYKQVILQAKLQKQKDQHSLNIQTEDQQKEQLKTSQIVTLGTIISQTIETQQLNQDNYNNAVQDWHEEIVRESQMVKNGSMFRTYLLQQTKFNDFDL